jgi:phosphoribosyl 1,2-cyclic phosphodiesterase
MALFIASLNSGSNGNCYYAGSQNSAVLIDVGLSCRETEKRLRQCDLEVKKIKAIFISHEHGDHIKGVSVFANKYNLPVYITDDTAKHGPHLIKHLSKNFTANNTITIDDITVTPFLKHHDAVHPHSFIISHNDITVGVFTDIGKVCEPLIEHFKKCHAAFLEANYDEDMLENGHYPVHLKNRIRGGNGHLSNREALDLFTSHRPPFMSHLILSHLSKENNNPQLAEALFNAHAGQTTIVAASRNEVSAVYTITANPNPGLTTFEKPRQLNLFT